jgi:hypothetical protein
VAVPILRDIDFLNDVTRYSDLHARVAGLDPRLHRISLGWYRRVATILKQERQLGRYRALVGPDPRGRFFLASKAPLADYMERFALASALVVGDPARVHEGMRHLGQATVLKFHAAPVVRRLVGAFGPTPLRVFRLIERKRGDVATYGGVKVTSIGRRHFQVHTWGEPLWPEVLIGTTHGILDLCCVRGRVDATIVSPEESILDVGWL